MPITRTDNIVDTTYLEDSWDGSVKDIVNITGQKKVVYILWGESPESPEFIKYGFETEAEARAFMCGVSQMDGYLGWQGADSAETFGKDNDYMAQTEDEFIHDIFMNKDYEGYDCNCAECKEERSN